MSVCLFPGSFDPPTAGHLDLIERASSLFDRVIVAVLINAAKKPMFSTEKRLEMLEKCTRSLTNVTVCSGDGLTVELARRMGANVLLRGVRGESDAGIEAQLAAANRKIGGLDTLALFTAPEHSYISSTVVRDVLRHGGSVKGLVPDQILAELTESQL